MKDKCVKAISAHISWGADNETLLHVYRSLIKSKLDYDSVVYGYTRPSYVWLILFRTMPFGYPLVLLQLHLVLVSVSKLINLRSASDDRS